uniref:Uncharacterized protein n=1 Tax=mine drainage metagenome TaxID=410659 RepID=E6PR45_9ZZZZ
MAAVRSRPCRERLGRVAPDAALVTLIPSFFAPPWLDHPHGSQGQPLPFHPAVWRCSPAAACWAAPGSRAGRSLKPPPVRAPAAARQP